jgi:chloramphenicol 3-O phosphotransferase
MNDKLKSPGAVAAQVILLNGVGSAGKTSIAKALQNQMDRPFLHVSMDDFIDMLPSIYHDHLETFTYRQMLINGFPEVAIDTGSLGAQVLRGMRCKRWPRKA